MRLPRPRLPVVLLTAIAACTAVLHGQPLAAVTRVEAAFLSKFPQFVEWPSAALADRPTLDVCVANPDPFGSELDDLLAGETVYGRSIAVRRVDRARDLDGCHVLFLSRRPGRRDPLLDAARSRPILTVGDQDDFLDQGGIIRLRVVAGRVRFDVNPSAAEAVGLRISSQLLQLALTVAGGTP
jgi:hypothetical protein